MGILFLGIMMQLPEGSDIAFLGLVVFALVAMSLSLSPLIIIFTA